MGVSSIGGLFHLSGELFNLTNIPFRGGTPLLTALLSNEVQLGFDGIPSVIEHVRAGKLHTCE